MPDSVRLKSKQTPISLGVVVGLAVLAPVLPGMYASTNGRFVMGYIVCLLLAIGAALLALYFSNQDVAGLEKPTTFHSAGLAAIPLGALAALAVGAYAASSGHYQRTGTIVFGLLHSLLVGGLAAVLAYVPVLRSY